eukprot:7503463-Alexandrium_andersonii.AAC.1
MCHDIARCNRRSLPAQALHGSRGPVVDARWEADLRSGSRSSEALRFERAPERPRAWRPFWALEANAWGLRLGRQAARRR